MLPSFNLPAPIPRACGARSRASGRARCWVPLSCRLLLAFALAGSGCVSGQRVRRERAKAFNEGRQQALAEQERQAQQQLPAVFFSGDVRNLRVPWREGLTLAEALTVAQYTWSWDPRAITLTRDGEVHTVNPKRLLRGQENPVLEPGDRVDVRH